jgi:hypothetical protein
MTTDTRIAKAPFELYTLAHVTRRRGQTATTPKELLAALESCSDESIYHHVILAMRSQLGGSGRVSNDFAQWAACSLKREELGERLANADLDCETIADLRRAICGVVRSYLEQFPGAADETAESPFYFCEGMEVAVPVDSSARTLEEFRQCIEEMGGESFYLHFVAPRTRREQQSNDFSVWLESSLGLDALARKINEIELEGRTLEEARERILELIDLECGGARQTRAASR